mmetsp:Transcript_32102/g.44505  ORF Transcript_32102/g.44505 Transcript_32102/m.44505 type:complete len:685 (-) Transcript_32102:544-2598(-)|eukprot:CAMPEP_0196580476 /NCGR_PEP_ID=MMETSP1081-20130531/28715_1 /TAXON_ID=36882 /ORGANISM="Pyramimonas amylifera, Strain CCMP720" /LENGTH=684 /DNA_ID=CAMNT_0041900345 /DNA_START=136 /DNA_END=2190 /DNA_ORIENTATION=+
MSATPEVKLTFSASQNTKLQQSSENQTPSVPGDQGGNEIILKKNVGNIELESHGEKQDINSSAKAAIKEAKLKDLSFSTGELQHIAFLIARLLNYEKHKMFSSESSCVKVANSEEQLEIQSIRRLLRQAASASLDDVSGPDIKQKTSIESDIKMFNVSTKNSQMRNKQKSIGFASGFQHSLEVSYNEAYESPRAISEETCARTFSVDKNENIKSRRHSGNPSSSVSKPSTNEALNEFGEYELGDGTFDTANRCFEETQLFAPELMLLLTLSSMYKPSIGGFCLAEVWPRFAKSAFVFCILVCSYRLFASAQYNRGPAFYNVYTNGALVLYHLWLPGSFFAVRSLINAPFFLESLREFSRIPPLRERINFFSRIIGFIGLILTGAIVIWIIVGWVVDMLDPYYVSSEDMTMFWFGVLSAISITVIVVPWAACLFSVYAMFHVVLEMLTLHVEELVYTLDCALDEMYSLEDRIVAQSKRRVTRSFYNCFQGMVKMSSKTAMKHMMCDFNAQSSFMGGGWALRHRKRESKLDIMPFKMKMWKLRTLVNLVTKRVNFMLVSLILVSVAMVLGPSYAIMLGVHNEDLGTWRHLLRDAFCITVGLLSFYLALWETSSFTEICTLAGVVINEMDFPDADDCTSVIGYFASGETKLGFHINGVLITKNVFYNFVWATLLIGVYFVASLSEVL